MPSAIAGNELTKTSPPLLPPINPITLPVTPAIALIIGPAGAAAAAKCPPTAIAPYHPAASVADSLMGVGDLAIVTAVCVNPPIRNTFPMAPVVAQNSLTSTFVLPALPLKEGSNAFAYSLFIGLLFSSYIFLLILLWQF
jgi:hypothetical protein